MKLVMRVSTRHLRGSAGGGGGHGVPGLVLRPSPLSLCCHGATTTDTASVQSALPAGG